MSKKLDDALARLYDLLVGSGSRVNLDPLVEVFGELVDARDELEVAVMKDNLTRETNLEHYYDTLSDMIKADQEVFEHELNFIDINTEHLMRKLVFDSRFHIPSDELLEWLVSPYREPEAYLDSTERNYLKSIIKPYLNLDYTVRIRKIDNNCDRYNIEIQVTHEDDFRHTITLPPFDNEEDMYTGMVPDKWYSSIDLGLE